MEFLALIALIVVFVPFVLPIISWVLARRTSARVAELEQTLDEQTRALESLKVQLAQLRRELRSTGVEAVPEAPIAVPPRVPETPRVVPPAALPPSPVPPSGPRAPEVAKPVPTVTPAPPAPAPRMPPAPLAAASSAASQPGPAAAERPPIAPPPRPPAAPPALRERFDLERIAGAKLFPAVAGITLVIGAIFFLQHSMAQGWLQPPVRVLIGLTVAIGLLVVCELKAARNYPSIANALDAAAIAILFATFFAAHALWNLIPGWLAFVLLGAVTAIAALLSIRRESLFIAVLGLLGGFATPVLLSTGENRPIPLFAYLLLLNIGLAWVAYRNTWPVLTALTLLFTTIYQWGWVARFLTDASQLPLAMGIFLVFPIAAVAALVLRRPAGGHTPADVTFEQTALLASAVPLAFGVFLAAVPAYGARASLLFGFLLIVDLGLLVVSVARRQMLLYATAAMTTVVVMSVWLGMSYVSDAKTVAIGFTAAFVLLFLAAEPLVAWWGGAVEREGRVGRYAAPFLLVVFAALAYLEPAFVRPLPLFLPLALLVMACAARSIAARDGAIYYIAAFFAVAAQAVWSVTHLTQETLRAAVLVYAAFGSIALGIPVLARRLARPLEPAGGGGVVLLASLGLLLYLSAGPVAPSTLWALALLLAVLNAGLFVESGGARLPAIAIAGSMLSWVILAVWWLRAAGSIGVLPSLTVLVGLSLVTFAGHAWLSRSAPKAPPSGDVAEALTSLLTSGLFLGLGGHLFLLLLSLNREWSLPPWPIFGALTVVTLGASAASMYARTPALHTASVTATAAVSAAWITQLDATPWPLTGLLAAVAVSAYALVGTSLWRRLGDRSIAPVGAAAALFIGEFTFIVAMDATGHPPLGTVMAAHAAGIAALLALTWTHRWRHVAIAVALTAWAAVFGWRGAWQDLLLLSSALYIVVVAYPFVLGRRVGRERDPHLAAVIASAMFFFSAREALIAGGFEWIVGLVPIIAAAVLALSLRQLLRLQGAIDADPGRLALVAGAALAFVTVAIPVQLEHQWITIGWALEGAALAWLFTRVPHRGLLFFTMALLAAVFARLAVNPEVFQYEPRGELRILNWYLYTYALAAGSFFAAAWWLSSTDDRVPALPMRASQILPAGGVVLLFLLLNIEIADYYATGPEIVFRFGAGVSQDLTYTIGWLAFGILLLTAGIYAGSRPARITAVALIAVTTFKCFLYDLGSMEGLYRVASFVGLGISLALVSLVLQKFVLARPRESS